MQSENKYGNLKTSNLCAYGFSHRSKLELAVCNQIAWEEKAGITKHLSHEDTQYLTDARIQYIPDFKCQNCATSEIYWVEAKGYADQKWPIKKKLWRFYGPGRLKIYGGSHAKLMILEEIIPERKKAI